MGMRISTNVSSINAQRTLTASQREINKSMAQLSSGSRITKAADDAAGLGISEMLKSQIRSYSQASRNANDAISMVQVAEGGLGEISNILTRMRELGIQAASDTVGDKERSYLNLEVSQLKEEVQRIAKTTKFGSTNLLDGTGSKFDIQVGINNDSFEDRISFDSSVLNATSAELGIDDVDYSNKEGAQDFLMVVDEAQSRVAAYRANVGALQNRFSSTIENLGAQHENLSAANSRIRDADIATSTSEMARNQVLLNASTSVLASANQQPQLALKLIG
ncbi:MAG: flagellin FliC [Bdellovibrionaceae bacterium]|nr:flagellin FliC [Pseudobdellovibrionaceae bacterium]